MPALEPQSSPSGASDVLDFACPSCHGRLSLPAKLASAEGPCPLCSVRIIGPDPARGLSARLAQSAPIADIPFGSPSPIPLAPPPQIQCDGCGTTLEIDPEATVDAGPCPVCGTWLQIPGGLPAPEAPPRPSFPSEAPATGSRWAEPPEAFPAEFPVDLPYEQLAALEDSEPLETTQLRAAPGEENDTDFLESEEATSPAMPSDEEFYRPLSRIPADRAEPADAVPEEAELESQESGMTERRIRKVKRRRSLPEECYVSTSGESNQEFRQRPFPPRGLGKSDGRLRRWVSILLAILVPLAIGLAIAVKFEWIPVESLRFWETFLGTPDSKSSRVQERETAGGAAGPEGATPSHEALDAQSEALADREDRSLALAQETTLQRFREAPTWDDARSEFVFEYAGLEESTWERLRALPRDTLIGREIIPVYPTWRIPDSERFVFELQVKTLIVGEEPLFLIVEETAEGRFQIHAEHLVQNWGDRLSQFWATPGAPAERFYLLAALETEETGLREEGYVPVRLMDVFSGAREVRVARLSEKSPAGMVLMTKLNPDVWTRVVLDLLWVMKPEGGDPFLEIDGLHLSNWGNFPK